MWLGSGERGGDIFSEPIVLVGASHKTLPIAQREGLSLLEKRFGLLLGDLRKELGLKEAAVISTCNRFEVVAVGEEAYDRVSKYVRAGSFKRCPRISGICI